MRTRMWVATLTLTLLAAACGSDDSTDTSPEPDAIDDETTSVETTDGDPDEEPADTDADDTTTDDANAAEEGAEDEPAAVPTTTVNLGILGGISFEAPGDAWIEGQNMFREILIPDPSGGVVDVRVMIGRVSQSGGGQPISTIDEMVAHFREVGAAEVTEGTDGIEVLGQQLRQFRVDGSDPAANFAAEPVGFVSLGGWEPDSRMYVYAAEIEGSLLVLASQGGNDTELETSEQLLRAVVPTIESTNESGTIPPQQTPDDTAEIPLSEAFISPVADPVGDEIPVLQDAFTNLDAGEYQVLGLNVPLRFDIPPSWAVFPNFPGFVVLASSNSRGPFRLDIRMHNEVELLVPLGDGHQPIGPGVAISPVEDLIASPPPNLTISNVDREVSFAGLPTVAFDVTLTDPHDCGPVERPCEYRWTTPTSEGSIITGVFAHRVWVVEDSDGGTLVLQMSNWPDAAEFWFEQAEPVLASAALLE